MKPSVLRHYFPSFVRFFQSYTLYLLCGTKKQTFFLKCLFLSYRVANFPKNAYICTSKGVRVSPMVHVRVLPMV